MSDPASPEQPLKLTPNEAAAVDPKFQSQHPELAALWWRKPYDTMTRSIPYQAGNWLNSNLKGMANHIAPLFQQGAGRGALAGGGMGLLAGFLGDKAMQYFTGKDPGMTWKLGLLGAGLGGYAGYQKKATHMQNKSLTKVAAAMVAALNHTDAQETRIALHTDASLHKSAEAAQGVMEKVAFQIAADAYASAAKMHMPEFHLFTKFAEMRRWSNDLQPYSDCVLSALGRNARYRRDLEAEERAYITKAANGAKLMATIAKVLPGAVRTGMRGALLTGAGAGAGAGALYWLANRHVKEDDNENEATRQKVDYYKNLTADISAQLKNKGLVAA